MNKFLILSILMFLISGCASTYRCEDVNSKDYCDSQREIRMERMMNRGGNRL